MNVDLPEPDGPIIATNSPAAIWTLTLFSAGGVSGAAVSYCLPRFSTRMMGVLITSSGSGTGFDCLDFWADRAHA